MLEFYQIRGEMKMKQGYRLILRQQEYCKLTFAEMINRFGDSIDAIALTWLIYAISQNPSLSSLILD